MVHQSINQGFRMVGSINDKYNLPVVAFKVGGKVSLDWQHFSGQIFRGVIA